MEGEDRDSSCLESESLGIARLVSGLGIEGAGVGVSDNLAFFAPVVFFSRGSGG